MEDGSIMQTTMTLSRGWDELKKIKQTHYQNISRISSNTIGV
jgi:hypothetical protein